MVVRDKWAGRDVVCFGNDRLECWICPELGNNLYRIWDKRAGREVLRTPAHPDALVEKPGHWGTPLMLPPNRIRNGRFSFEGKSYQLEVNTPQGHHIHGFVRQRPWEIVGTRESGALTSVLSRFDTRSFPELFSQYPHHLEVLVRYDLTGGTLSQTASIRNMSDSSAPVGWGLHTWFQIDGEPERWSLTLPVRDVWELDTDLMPSGAFSDLGEFSELGRGMSVRGADFDTVFRVGERKPDALLRRDDGYTIRYTPSEAFKHWVIYTMGVADQVICLEPYTWVTNAPNLPMDPAVTGFHAVAPGETWELSVKLAIAEG